MPLISTRCPTAWEGWSVCAVARTGEERISAEAVSAMRDIKGSFVWIAVVFTGPNLTTTTTIYDYRPRAVGGSAGGYGWAVWRARAGTGVCDHRRRTT